MNKSFTKELIMKLRTTTTSNLINLSMIITVLVSACSPQITPAPTVDVSVFYTQAAATIALGLTQTSEALPSPTLPAPTATIEPSTTPVPEIAPTKPPKTAKPASQPVIPTLTPIPIDPATAHGCYNASFIEDVTIRYAPAYKPGERFTKTWRVKNTGSCDWPRGFKIVFLSGNHFGTDTSFIDQKVSAGSTADISLEMTAPELFGVVTSNWQLATDIGKFFGPVLSVAITLPSAGTTPGKNTSGCLNSELVADVSIPTGTEIDANTTFTKTWKVKNTGTCTWNRDFKMVFVGGDMFGSDTTKIRQEVGPGSNMEISLEMQAPGESGTISSAWQLASDSGQLFGQLFAFSINVK